MAKRIAATTSVGFLEPAEVLNAIIVAGTIVTLDVFIARKVHGVTCRYLAYHSTFEALAWL